MYFRPISVLFPDCLIVNFLLYSVVKEFNLIAKYSFSTQSIENEMDIN